MIAGLRNINVGVGRQGFVFDPLLVTVIAMLLMLGLTMMTSPSIAVAERNMGEPLYYLQRQGVYLTLGLLASGLFLLLPTRIWEATGFVSLSVALGLLALVLGPGVAQEIKGSTRWIDLGPMNMQVSEPARLLLLFYLCGYLVRHHEKVRESFSGFAKPMLFILLASAMLLLEPDFGATTVLLGTTLGLMFIGGVRLRDYFLLVVLAVAAMAAIIVTSPERVRRLKAFVNPWADAYAYGDGFQLTQSLIAIGRGEWFGVGLGGSVQKLFYLPEAHTDFVFAVLAEELGLVGIVVTIVLYAVLVLRGFAIGRRAADAGLYFQSYLAQALVIWLGLQVTINIGVNMGVLPTKGLTLPLMSYGGSSLIITLVALALLLRIHHETRVAPPPKAGGRA